MKVIHLTAGSLNGGAARGALWLHRALHNSGIESTLLTNGEGIDGDDTIQSLSPKRYQRLRFDIRTRIAGLRKLRYPRRQPWFFSTGFDGIDLSSSTLVEDADIVHLHWVNGLLSLKGLRRMRKPVVWTLRDMWPFTGGCHYTMGCDRYEDACGKCPQLQSSTTRDLSALVLSRKLDSLPDNICVVPISEWLAGCARRSALFSQTRIETIYNCVDTTEFFPIPQIEARRALGLPNDRRIVALGAQRLQDFYKGTDLALEALRQLADKNLHLLIFGDAMGLPADKLPAQSTLLGFVKETGALRMAYSAADVFVAPSRMEAFGKTLIESMACGTPVVCFDKAGPGEIVDHEVTGYKARPFCPSDMARGIEWVLGLRQEEALILRESARKRAETKFDAPVVAGHYLDLYRRVLT